MNNKAELLLTAIRLASVTEALELLTVGDVQEAGRRAHLLAFVMGCSPCTTQKDLAARLGVTPARICQMLRVFNRVGAIRLQKRGGFWRNSP
jgi:DNA-binding MarR family transcriptional regulator